MYRFFKDRCLLLALVGVTAAVSAFPQAKGAAAKFRTITISSEPKAIVWLDDVRYGTTDDTGNLEIRTVSAGRHTLRVRAAGFKEVSQPITALQKGAI